MAKARRQKNEDQKPESSGCVLLHQKLCLSIDMENKRIYGYTELKILVRDGEQIALHADNMRIGNILVDGEPAEYEHFSHFQEMNNEARWSTVACAKSAADAACSAYLSSLSKETAPNLIISRPKSEKLLNGQCQQENGGNAAQISSEEQPGEGCNGHLEDKLGNAKLVRIDYLLESVETGVHLLNNILHTNNQIRRAHCWFPCMDTVTQCCYFDLEFTVATNFLAVSNGNLLYQVLTKDDPPRKTVVYKLSAPVSAQHISLVVAPLEVLPDNHNGVVSHMCMSPSLSKLQNTVAFFHNIYSYYEDYLSVPFPFGSYKQIFLPSEVLVSSLCLGASMCVFSSDLLYDSKVIDQTINTRTKLAYALARQWFGVYVTAEEPSDEWLLDGLAGFLTDNFIKRFLGNNEARFRRFKANCAVCKLDVNGTSALNSSAASTDLYGTQAIGLYGKIRAWKAVVVLQMLEKQMGPDSFRKILQMIVGRELGSSRSRKISTKEFRHLVNKVGNLERPFLKEFFPRWVESCGCPLLRMGVSYNKRRNMVELAVMRDCTAVNSPLSDSNPGGETREGGESGGWPGMMSMRVHELDGVYDHPILPMAGDTWQVLEIQCHSKLAAKRVQKPKKGSKPDGSDDNADVVTTQDTPRTSMDSPLLWIRVDPEMEFLAEIHFHQPIQMWINQLEKDKDVVAQSQAIAVLEKLPQLSFSVISSLNNFLHDSKVYWRVRIEAAYTLAVTASEETDLAGLLNLVKFYKSRRFDADIGLPRPNDFRDIPEYFVLEAIPHAVALVRAADRKSPREAIEFVLQLLKYNDNNGNFYSDAYWLAAMVQAIGELEFGQQSMAFLTSLLKRIDHLLQFDSFMPSHNGVLTISCIRTLAQIALKMSMPPSVCLDHVYELIKPFRGLDNPWKVRIEASKVILDLEFHHKGLDEAISLFLKFLDEEQSLRGETKLAIHVMHLCQVNMESHPDFEISSPTLFSLLRLLGSKKSFDNIFLRHHLFCIFQIVARRSPTLYGVTKTLLPATAPETPSEPQIITTGQSEQHMALEPQITNAGNVEQEMPSLEPQIEKPVEPATDTSKPKEADTVSHCSERKVNIVKIRVKQSSSKIEDDDNNNVNANNNNNNNNNNQKDHSRGGGPNENEVGPCSSMSVDAPIKGANETTNIISQNNEEVNSFRDRESRMTASIGSSARLGSKHGETSKELQCTVDSKDQLSPTIVCHDGGNQTQPSTDVQEAKEKKMKEKKDKKDKKDKKEKEKKRKREDKPDMKDDPEYLERKHLKKEKKRMEKELAKMQSKGAEQGASSSEPQIQNVAKPEREVSIVGPSVQPLVSREKDSVAPQASTTPKIRIKIKGLGIGNTSGK